LRSAHAIQIAAVSQPAAKMQRAIASFSVLHTLQFRAIYRPESLTYLIDINIFIYQDFLTYSRPMFIPNPYVPSVGAGVEMAAFNAREAGIRR